MGQPILEEILLDVARKWGSQDLSISTDGTQITREQIVRSINAARRELYRLELKGLGIEKFSETYKEFLKEQQDISLTNASNYTAIKPDYCRKLMLVKFFEDRSSTMYEAKPLPVKAYYEAEIDTYSTFRGTLTDARFMEISTTFKVFGITAGDYISDVLFLEDIIPAVLGGVNPDITDPVFWMKQITELAYQDLLQNYQIR